MMLLRPKVGSADLVGADFMLQGVSAWKQNHIFFSLLGMHA